MFFHEPYLGVDDAARSLHAFEIVCAMRERTAFPAELLDRLPNLRLLVTTGMRNASIDLEAAAARGVTVCGTEAAGTPTAELAWGLILALARHIPEEDAKVRAGGWQSTVGTGLAGKTLGIVGLGRLGSAVARIGTAFGMRLVAWSENLTAERAAECGAELVSKDELLRTADVVTIHLVLSDRTRGLIGERELGLMKPTAFLVNTSRGPIVDEAALVAALEAASDSCTSGRRPEGAAPIIVADGARSDWRGESAMRHADCDQRQTTNYILRRTIAGAGAGGFDSGDGRAGIRPVDDC